MGKVNLLIDCFMIARSGCGGDGDGENDCVLSTDAQCHYSPCGLGRGVTFSDTGLCDELMLLVDFYLCHRLSEKRIDRIN